MQNGGIQGWHGEGQGQGPTAARGLIGQDNFGVMPTGQGQRESQQPYPSQQQQQLSSPAQSTAGRSTTGHSTAGNSVYNPSPSSVHPLQLSQSQSQAQAPPSSFGQVPRSSVSSSITPTDSTMGRAGDPSSTGAPLRVDRPGPGLSFGKGTGSGTKKRKKSTTAKTDLPSVSPSSPPGDSEKEKRTKTGRACDACRTKKIRCDILQQIEAKSSADVQPICAHCKQYDLECTFFLPITETRFKKKKLTNGSAGDTQPPLATEVLNRGPTGMARIEVYPGKGPSQEQASRIIAEPVGRVEGPTSINFLLHTTIPNIPSEAYDLRHHNSWEVLEDGNGLIRVKAPPTATGYADADPKDPTKAHNRLNKSVLSAQTMSLLVNAYFNEIAPLFPIISRQEFGTKSNPSPLLLYSICGLGATRRQFPREVFAGVRGMINGLLRSNDLLSDARFENVQALLLLAQVGDLHAQPTAATASASLVRTGAAIRMAQDIGLHRESAMRPRSAADIAYIELRRRVWATCVIMDRWYGAALGVPLLVDLLDCDVLLPAPYDISAGGEPSSWPIESSFMGITEHLKLSILIGRVLKTIYSPTGLKHTTDSQLEALLNDMTRWMDNLPEQCRFHGPDSSHVAGLLHLGHAALQFLFWRVFMRITHVCPPHLKFSVSVEHWSKLIHWSRESLQWLDRNDDALDTLFIYPYAATSCALIQYHTWARRKDPEALETLKLVKETAQRWEDAVQPDQMSIRRKTCETMTLLYDAALKTNPDSLENTKPRKLPANPTAGVTPRPEGFSKLNFVRNDQWSGGGRFVAPNAHQQEQAGMPEGDVLIALGGRDQHRDQGAEQTLANTNAKAQRESDTNANRQAEHQKGLRDYQNPTLSHHILANPQAMRQEIASNVNPQLNFDENNPLEPMQVYNGGFKMYDGFVPNSNLQANDNQNFLGMTGVNSNPDPITNANANGDINFNGLGAGVGGQMTDTIDQSTFDPSFLDSLPASSFDWDSWSTYFDKLLPPTQQGYEGVP